MANKNKNLGSDFEQRVVDAARAAGCAAARQPGSGVYADFPSDVTIEDILVECKVRSTADKSVRVEYDWLDKVRALAVKHGYARGVVVANPKGGRHPVVVMDLDDFLALLVVHT